MDKRNYIVSGLERSGTSLLMSMLAAGGVPVAYNNLRPPDRNNPKGYFELEGGKIINRLIKKEFQFDKYIGKFIKITSFGLGYLPGGNKYTVIYTERDIEEILTSMDKMTKRSDKSREQTRRAYTKLNRIIKEEMEDRLDVSYMLVNYNDIVNNPRLTAKKISKFLKTKLDIDAMCSVVDNKLYRNRNV